MPKKAPLRPRDPAEVIALFRSEIVGAIARREMTRGEPRRGDSRDRRLSLPSAGPAREQAVRRLDDRALVLRVSQGRPRRAAAHAALRSRSCPRADARAARVAPRRSARVSDRVGTGHRAYARRRRSARQKGRLGDDRASAVPRSRPDAGRAPRRAHAAALAGRSRRRALARRRLPRPGAAHRQDDQAAAYPRAPRRHVALRGRTRGTPHRARGRHARHLPARASQARRPRCALPRQWRDVSRRGTPPRVRAPRHLAAARASWRRAGARQDGAVLAHVAPGLPRPPRRDDDAARRAGAPARVPRRALSPRAAWRPVRQAARRRLGRRLDAHDR